MKKTPLKRKTPLKAKTPLKSKTGLKPFSKKRAKQMIEYDKLVIKLRYLCDNKSELSGAYPCYLSDFKIDPHHIDGREGKLLLNPFNIICLTRTEHSYIQEHNTTEKKQELLAIVKKIRLSQGFKEEDYK